MRHIKLSLLFALVLSSHFAIAQNVGIGTTNPLNQLQIGNPPGFSGNHLAIGNGTQGMSFFQSTGSSTWFTNTNFALMPAFAGNGLVGIGTATPAYNLDIYGANAQINLHASNGATATLSRYTNRLEIQPSDAFEISVGGVDQRNLCVASNGGVGISTSTPTNLLQVGTYTNTNYSGNQLAFGFGTNVTVMNQYASYFNLLSSSAMNIQSAKDMYLMPENGSGNVGINTNAPAVALDVNGNVNILGTNGAAALTIDGGIPEVPSSNNSSLTHCSGFCGTDNLSIQTAGEIWADAFYAFSDARYKDIQDISNSSKDLQTLNTIKITDYTLKDKMISGDKPYKKIIAQQVEEVYPQIVNKGVNYIPNVYQFTNKIEKTEIGYLLTFTNKHNISKDATKIKLQDGTKMQQYNIVAIPSENQVLVNGNQIKSDNVFVYGEQVNDFRTVDYDGLTTLNISATQELSKLVTKQQEEIDSQNAKIDELIAMVKKLKKKR